MRVAIGGFMHESNTFAPLPTDLNRFRDGSLTYGDAVIPVWQDAHHEVGGFIEGAKAFGYTPVPVAMAWATPAGPVSDEFFAHFTDALVTGLKLARANGVLLALHGAMVTPKYPDADAEALRRVRAALGPTVPLAVTLDFHGNVSPQMAETANILVGYQTYPHVDQRQRGRLAAQLLARAQVGTSKPVCHVAKPPMLLNLLGQDTAREPMAGLMRRAREIEARPGVLSVSLMAGFPYADVPDMGASVIAVADGDPARARAAADELATAMWAARADLNVLSPEPEEAVRRALAGTTRPALLIDLGDNIGGGSAGDGTVLLAELLKQHAKGFVVPMYAPAAVEQAKAAGIGRAVEVAVGGSTGDLHGPQLRVRGTVRSLHEGKWVEVEARHGGRRQNDQGHTAVLDLGDGNLLVLNTLRTPPFSLGQLTSLGIDPKVASAIVVKAAVAYKAAYAPLGGEIIEVDTPGLTAINAARFEYARIRRPMYPLDAS
ncbi:MAG: M81 family metallopeptidase [Gemmata sp.]